MTKFSLEGVYCCADMFIAIEIYRRSSDISVQVHITSPARGFPLIIGKVFPKLRGRVFILATTWGGGGVPF